jgi:predicted nucleotidyltransferase component of viral defense system
MTRPPRDIGASVRARLLARYGVREEFQFVLQRYASERFLYRLGRSPHRHRLVLKGGMLLALWGGSAYRPTRDLDFAGFGSPDPDSLLASFREICAQVVEDDGLAFDLASLAAEPIRDAAEYGGLRITVSATLAAARIPLQIDVGFGDAIEPAPEDVVYPTLLDAPAPRVRAYAREPAIAEKLHAMVEYGERNTRYRDFYDVFTLAQGFEFEGRRLARAVAATFERRSRPIDVSTLPVLTATFFADDARAAQWRSYLRKNDLVAAPGDFAAVGELLRSFLGPAWDAVAAGSVFDLTWKPGGPWRIVS